MERYQIVSLVQEDIGASLYHGELTPSNRPTLIKELKQMTLNPKTLARLRHDFDILREHPTSASLEAYALIEQDGNVALCLEDIKGIFLSELLKQGAISYKEFLPLAQMITRALGTLHSEHIIHKNLNPSDILWCPEKKLVKILDFSIATTLEKETPTDVAGSVLEGTLAYMSPEQTGRMNISLDYRSDFYALGIIFYQLLTGRLPFEQTDMLALVHAHLALLPDPPHRINSSVPELLSNIILKLLDKRPDERYQTASGLLQDLEKAAIALEKNEAPFKLGEGDVNPNLQISSKLYGREKMIQILQEDYAQVLQGNKYLTLVAGAPGIGKTSLVNELYKPITERAGFFIRGKYDQLHSGTPYSALAQAFGNLIRQILLAPEEEVQIWKKQLNEALSPNGQIMVNIIPTLQYLIGIQEAPPTIDPTQEENRLHYIFEQFIRVVATEDHPLALFLDDLQWIDLASLKIFQHLFSSEASRWLYFVGAYRDTEVSETHPLMHAIDQFKKAGIETHQLKLGPLSEEASAAWLADTLANQVKEVESLAKLCYQKTAGNPFFLKQFVQALYEDRFLKLDLEQKRWIWDIKQVEEKQMTDNVIELMTSKIKSLPREQVELLKLAACIGNRFNLEMLLNITGQSLNEVSAILWELFRIGLILPENEEYKYLNQEQVRAQSIACYFLHDRVQEAAYSLMDENSREKTHLNIGRLLLKNISESDYEVHLFEIVNHLNKGRRLITDPVEKENLVKFNFLGSQKAIQATAFVVTKELIAIGLELLGEKCWEKQYQMTLGFYQYLALANLLLGQHDKVHEIAKIGINQGKTALDRSAFYYIRIGSYSIVSDYEAGVEMTRQSLRELGLKMPRHPYFYYAAINYLKIRWALRNKKIADLANDQPIQDPTIKAIVRVLTGGHLAMSFSSEFYFPWEVSIRTFYLIKYGFSEEAPAVYADTGYWLNFDELDVQRSCEFGELAKYIIKTKPNSPYNIQGQFLCNSYVDPLSISAHDIFEKQKAIYQLSKRNTDAVWGLIAIGNGLMDYLWIQNKKQTLEVMAAEYLKHMKEIQSSQNPFLTVMATESFELIKILMGDHPVPAKFIDEAFLKDELPDNFHPFYYTLASILAFSCDAYDHANETLEKSMRNNPILPKSYGMVIMRYFYPSLIKLAIVPKVGFWRKRKHLKMVRQNQKRLKRRMQIYKHNLEHFYLLVEAEICRVTGKDLKAQHYYSLAIEAAEKNDFVWALAMCNELAAKYYHEKNQLDIARFYMQEALMVYSNWGALGKVRQLEALYPNLCVAKKAALSSRVATVTSTITATSSAAIDLSSVMRANQAISGEIQLQKLMEKMLQIVVENAGAEKAMFLEKINNQWKPLAQMEERSQKTKFEFFSENVVTCEFPEIVINYCVRTQEPLVLANAMESSEFQNDPYIRQHQVRSLLCMPIVQHQEILGLIYLENNLTMGSFTQNRLDILKSLSAQISVSLKNSHYIENMQRLNEKTERFVPKRFLEIINKENIEEAALGDCAMREISVLFNDIRSFTTLVENRTPEEAFAFVNRYWKFMAPIIRKYGGYIDHYQGDAILAIFPNKPEDSVAAAVEMMAALTDFNKEQAKENDVAINMGIGISTGPAMLGIIGEEERHVSGLISDVANTASRVEGLNKIYGSRILLSDATAKVLPENLHILRRQVDKVRLKGKKNITEIFEVIEWQNELKTISVDEYLKLFLAAFAAYQAGNLKEAKLHFSNCLELFPDDKAAQTLLKRCQALLRDGLPKNWDGAYTLMQK